MNSENVIFDIDLFGNLDSQGNLKEYYNSDALTNAFKVWLVGSKGASLRSNNGGYLTPYLHKFINEDNAKAIQRALLSGIKNDFEVDITVTTLDVIGDPKNSKWYITLVAYSPELQQKIDTTTVVQTG